MFPLNPFLFTFLTLPTLLPTPPHTTLNPLNYPPHTTPPPPFPHLTTLFNPTLTHSPTHPTTLTAYLPPSILSIRSGLPVIQRGSSVTLNLEVEDGLQDRKSVV